MPEFTFESCIFALCVAMFIAQFFRGWRCLSVVGFIFIWMMFTPLRPWYMDIPLMFFAMILTEMFYRFFLKIEGAINE